MKGKIQTGDEPWEILFIRNNLPDHEIELLKLEAMTKDQIMAAHKGKIAAQRMLVETWKNYLARYEEKRKEKVS